jgi:hypothetical protein
MSTSDWRRGMNLMEAGRNSRKIVGVWLWRVSVNVFSGRWRDVDSLVRRYPLKGCGRAKAEQTASPLTPGSTVQRKEKRLCKELFSLPTCMWPSLETTAYRGKNCSLVGKALPLS